MVDVWLTELLMSCPEDTKYRQARLHQLAFDKITTLMFRRSSSSIK
jgi:hypothetical protein